MRIGLFAPAGNPFATPEYLRALGEGAEARGFHSIWVGEHVVLFDQGQYRSAYPYSPDGSFPAPSDMGMLEPFTVLAFLADCTQRIRLGTGVCLVPQRNPVYTAKEAATVDWLSGGRLDFGVGIGWLAEEFAALGVPFERRGARCREYLAIIERLRCDPVSSYEGEFYRLPPCRLYPKPLQQPHPPIHFGGESKPALRRAADLGQGWFGFNLGPEEAARCIGELRTQCEGRGRRLEELEISVSPYMRPVTRDDLARYREAGVDQVILMVLAPDRAALPRTLDELAEEFVEPARRL